MKQPESNILYIDEHTQCESYNYDGGDSLVNILKLKPGEIYNHNLNMPKLCFICQGEISIISSKSEKSFKAGKMILLPPGIFISVKSIEDTSILTCKVVERITFCELLRFEELLMYVKNPDEVFSSLKINNAIQLCLDSFISCIEDKVRCRHYIKIKIKEIMILIRAYYPKEEIAAFFLPLLGPDQLFRIFIDKNAPYCGSVRELQQKANMSENGFRMRFKRVMNCTPSEFVNKKKAECIRYELLCGNDPIKEVCEKFGFSTLAGFSLFCKKYLGNTPAAIRSNPNPIAQVL